MKFSFTQNSGQTLLEVIIALGFIVLGLVSIISLTTRGLSVSRESSNSLIAMNLAREGIEVVHGIRDSNWLKKISWDEGISRVDLDYTAIPVFDMVAGAWTLDFKVDDITSAPVYFNDGIYFQKINPNMEIISTPIFYRLLTFSPIKDVVHGFDEPILVGINVECRVRWMEHGRVRNVRMVETLYNWR